MEACAKCGLKSHLPTIQLEDGSSKADEVKQRLNHVVDELKKSKQYVPSLFFFLPPFISLRRLSTRVLGASHNIFFFFHTTYVPPPHERDRLAFKHISTTLSPPLFHTPFLPHPLPTHSNLYERERLLVEEGSRLRKKIGSLRESEKQLSEELQKLQRVLATHVSSQQRPLQGVCGGKGSKWR